jgi:subtilisin family serine protease
MKFIFTVFFVLAASLSAFSREPINHNSVVEINENEVYYEQGKFLLKLHDRFAYIDLSGKGIGTSGIGIPAITDLNLRYRVKSIKKIFPFVKKINLQPNDLTTIYEIEYNDPISPVEISKFYAEITEVQFAEPDYIASILVNPNDPYYKNGSQTYHSAVKANDAWELTTGDASQIIGIIDTGVDWGHLDLTENIWKNIAEQNGQTGVDDDSNGFVDDIRGWDFVNDDNNPMDDNSHGTHVAGIAGAKTNNNIGIAGISWNSKLMAIKVMQSSGRGSWSDIAQGAAYAAENGTTVINMSLGGYTESLTMKTALENAYHYSVLVAAAGNDGLCLLNECMVSAAMFPACYPWVLGVQASQEPSGLCGIRACWSNFDPTGPTSVGNPYGYNYEVLAPGQNIYSTIPGNGYRYLSGTSMATPVTSGAVALIKSYLPNISTEELFARIIQASGSGVLDIKKAMTIQLVPDVRLESFTILDTLANCDKDGRADAGETVLINIKVKNYGGWAQNVNSEIKLGEFEDKSVAILIDSISTLQNLSSYAQVNNNDNPFKITIPDNIANNRDIVFTVKTKANNWLSTNSKKQTVTIENGIELNGIYEGMGIIHLESDKYYIVNGPFVCDSLIIEPGTTLRIDNRIFVNYYLSALGKPDSMITFTNNGDNKDWIGISSKYDLKQKYFFNYNMNYCNFFKNETQNFGVINNSVFSNCYLVRSGDYGRLNYNVITNNYFRDGAEGNLLNSIFINNKFMNSSGKVAYYFRSKYLSLNNSIFNSYRNDGSFQWSTLGFYEPWGIYSYPPTYFGSLDSVKINNLIMDFYDLSTLPVTIGKFSLNIPQVNPHGHVWQVLVNDVNPYDEQFEPVGSESVKFDVYFNRAMDTNFTPFLTFGVREPYTQNSVIDSSKWISWKQNENIGDTYYHLQVSDKADFSNLIIDKNDILDLNLKYILNGNKEYFWKVRYKNGLNGSWYDWSEVKNFKTKQTRKAKVPIIIYPFNNDTLANNEFFLFLDEDIFAQRFYYELSTDVDFSSIFSADTFNINKKYIQNLVSGQTYYLRAKSININGISDFCSNVKFRVRETNNYTTINLISPINNDTSNNITNRIFRWNNVPWASKYQIQIGTSTAFTTLIHESFLTDTTLKFYDILSTGIKYWRVKAISGNIESPWSQVFKFTIPAKTINISLDSVFTFNLINYNGAGLDSNEISILPDGTYYWRFGTENAFYKFDVINKKCQTNIPIDKAKWMDTNVTFRWNNGPKANTIYNARWQAYHTMDFTTGDGLQMIRVAGAKDNEGFEIPVEWNRFQFEVQATAALSNDFIADGKVGKIDLEWGMPDVEGDILGFNLYRFKKKTLTTWGDTAKVNNILIVDTSYVDYNIIPDSTYYYVYRIVRTTLDEGEDSRMVSASAFPTVLDPPALLYPPNDTTKMPVSFLLDWDEPSGATSYIIQIARDKLFNDIVTDTEINLSHYQVSGLSNRTIYYWRVKAEGIQGVSNWSQIRNFRTIPILPSVPTLVFPENNSVAMPLAMTFEWNIANEADNYQFQVADDEFFGNLLHDISGITTTQRYISNLAINKTYFWRVRSKNEAGFSNWTVKWKFTTDTSAAAKVPESWAFTDFTGNSSTIVVPKEITPKIGERDILPGDAVGVFYTNNGLYKCAGYGIWENKNLAITVWGDDEQTPDKDGFDIDENYEIKLWDSRDEKEHFAVVSYSSGNSFYTINGYSVLGELESAVTVEQEISLRFGWNLISTNVEPFNKSMPVVWNDIKSFVNLVKNSAGQSYIPNFNINQIGNWNKYEGYQVSMKELKTLKILGIPFKPENTPISLASGWKMVSYLRSTPMLAPTALATLVSQNALTLCKNNAGQSYIPQYNINQIGNLQPGQGYQMFLSKNATLTYPANSLGKASSGGDNIAPLPKVLIPEHKITGNNSILLVQHNSPNGNEIGVYNHKDMLIGSGIFHNGIASITIWGDDEYTEIIDGAIINDELRIKNYDAKTGRLSEIELTDLVDIITDKPLSSLSYSKDGFVIANAKDIINISNISLDVRPNPASEYIEIEFYTPDCKASELKIYSIEGKLISDLSNNLVDIKNNKLTQNISNFTSGEYTIVISCGNERAMRKIVVVK